MKPFFLSKPNKQIQRGTNSQIWSQVTSCQTLDNISTSTSSNLPNRRYIQSNTTLYLMRFPMLEVSLMQQWLSFSSSTGTDNPQFNFSWPTPSSEAKIFNISASLATSSNLCTKYWFNLIANPTGSQPKRDKEFAKQ